MNSAQILDELDCLIAQRSILQHPFYQAWSAGHLTRDDLATYARTYYPHVAAFPDYLATAAGQATDGAVRAELLDNLREELSVPVSHAELWLRFGESIGASRAEVLAAEAAPETSSTTRAFHRLSAQSSAAALASLYAYESQQPEVSKQKEHGLREHYGVGDARALEYFTVHAEADVRHREGERQALARCLDAGATRDEVLDAANQALDAYWRLLDGVCREATIPLAC